MKDRNVRALFELSFDFKAAGSRDVLQINAAKGSGNQGYCADELIHILGLDTERESIHITERFEKDALALHDRHAGFRTDIAQSQNSRTICNDCAHVVPSGQIIGLVYILLDLQAGLGHAGCICQRQVFLVLDRNAGDHFNLALPLTMQSQRFFCVIHRFSSSFAVTCLFSYAVLHTYDKKAIFRSKKGSIIVCVVTVHVPLKLSHIAYPF